MRLRPGLGTHGAPPREPLDDLVPSHSPVWSSPPARKTMGIGRLRGQSYLSWPLLTSPPPRRIPRACPRTGHELVSGFARPTATQGCNLTRMKSLMVQPLSLTASVNNVPHPRAQEDSPDSLHDPLPQMPKHAANLLNRRCTRILPHHSHPPISSEPLPLQLVSSPPQILQDMASLLDSQDTRTRSRQRLHCPDQCHSLLFRLAGESPRIFSPNNLPHLFTPPQL